VKVATACVLYCGIACMWYFYFVVNLATMNSCSYSCYWTVCILMYIKVATNTFLVALYDHLTFVFFSSASGVAILKRCLSFLYTPQEYAKAFYRLCDLLVLFICA